MVEALAALGVDLHVASTTANGRSELRMPLDKSVMDGGVRYFYFPRQHPKSWTFSWPLTRWLAQQAHTYDVLHVHALFSYPTLPACWAARRAGVPYVLSPHGMLDPWSLRFRAWKKAPYLRVLERRNLLGAAAIHTISHREQRALEALGLPIREVTIPHGVNAPAVRDAEGRRRRGRATDDVVNILFLSRLHPKKGVELLLEAVEALTGELHLRLFVAGDGDAAYVKRLQARAESARLKKVVSFVGFVDGVEKERLLQEADLFVLPSYDENFGLAVAEALSVGLPVVVSEHVALAEAISEAGAGLVVPSNAQGLAHGIATLVSDPDLRHRMGQAGQRLARSELSWPEAGRRLAALYREISVSPARSDAVKDPVKRPKGAGAGL